MPKKIFAFDAETNGLWGEAFAISAVIYNGEKIIDKFDVNCGVSDVTDQWVIDNIVPLYSNIPPTHKTYDEMLKNFAEFYIKYKKNSEIVVYIGVPVEAKIIIDMQSKQFISEYEAPFPLFDVSSFLKAKGKHEKSFDEYIRKNNLLDGHDDIKKLAKHHSLYDAYCTALVYSHLRSN